MFQYVIRNSSETDKRSTKIYIDREIKLNRLLDKL